MNNLEYEIGKGYPCELCGSSDNVKYFANGSLHCFTNGCPFHKHSIKDTDITPRELVQGEYQSLANRRISQRTCEVFGYQIGTYNNQPCHIANIRNDTGQIIAQQLRLPNKQFLMTGNCSDLGLVGKHLWGNKGRAIVITEGYIDMLSIAEMQDCKWPVVTVPNGAASAVKAIKRDLAWLLNFDSIVLCFDNDEAGKKAMEDCVGLFPPGRLKLASLSEKDANDVLVKGKGKELTNIVFTASEYRPDGIVWGNEIDVEELFKAKPRGISLPYPALDEAIRGLKPGRIYTIYAGTGNGKSTSMREIALHISKQHSTIKIANIFLEESLGFTALSYMAMLHNIPAYKIEENPNLLTQEQKDAGKTFISNMAFYKHFGSLDSKHLINLLDYLVVGRGVNLIMLDHISLLVSGMRSESGEGERRDIDMLVTNLRSFCERTSATIVCATQLKRKEKSYSKGAEITESDARGSGAIEHISDVVFSLNVNDDAPYDAQIKIIKNRITGFKGNVDLITYNPETGRYLPKPCTLAKIQSGYIDTGTELKHFGDDDGEML
jgi:twinkle protein